MFEAVDRDARLSDKVTDAILATILSNRLKPGDALPPERELGKQFGVSRTVIREAIRALHAKGLLEVRSGSGVRIVAVDAKTVRESMRHFVAGSMLDYAKVDEVRRVLEVAAAGIAAERATAADLEHIDETLRQMTESVDDLAARSTSPSTARWPRPPTTSSSACCTTRSARCWSRCGGATSRWGRRNAGA